MLGVYSIALVVLLTHGCQAKYDPAQDDIIRTDDVDVIVNKNGRPDMKHLQKLIEKQGSEENAEGFEEVGIPPEEMTEEEKEEELEGMLNERKRFVINNPHHFWDFGILPYKFDSALPWREKRR